MTRPPDDGASSMPSGLRCIENGKRLETTSSRLGRTSFTLQGAGQLNSPWRVELQNAAPRLETDAVPFAKVLRFSVYG